MIDEKPWVVGTRQGRRFGNSGEFGSGIFSDVGSQTWGRAVAGDGVSPEPNGSYDPWLRARPVPFGVTDAAVRMKNVLCARSRLLGSILAVLLLAACATPPPGGEAEMAEIDRVNDPFEAVNRGIFSFNQFVDGVLFEPLAMFYRDVLPPAARDSVENFLNNLRSPVTLASDLAQGKMDRATTTVGRFVINSTIGVGGLIDMAEDFGLEGHREDFGQTLAVWGSEEGLYLVLPLFGPSNVRDAVGLVTDAFIDPLTYFASTQALAARTFVRGIDERESVLDTLDEIERTSIDFYATLRSLYRQRRADDIRDGRPAPVIPIPSISIDDFEGDKSDQATLVN